MRTACYGIVDSQSTPQVLVIRDVGPWDKFLTITNAADEVVDELRRRGALPLGRRLLYYDSENVLTQLLHDERGFIGFAPPWPRNFGEILGHLREHPLLDVESDNRLVDLSGRRQFVRFERGCLWTKPEGAGDDAATFCPIGCRAHGDETGIDIDPDGFTVTKFGAKLRFRYVSEQPQPR